MATICLQCGDEGWDNAFVYCIGCLEVGVHRYCLDQIPETLDEFVEFICDFCKEEQPNQYTILKESSIPAQKMNNRSPKNAKPVEVPVLRSCDDRGSYKVDGKNKSQNGSGDATVGFLDNAKTTGFGEDEKKSWNDPTKDDVEGSLESPKAVGSKNKQKSWNGVAGSSKSPNATSWEDKKKSLNDTTWDDVAGSLESQKVIGWAYSSIGSNMDDNKKSWNCQWDDNVGFLDTSMSMGQKEDKKKSCSGPTWNDVIGPLECVKATRWEDDKKSWNGPTRGDVVGSLKRPKVSSWADNSIMSLNSLDPTTTDMQIDDIGACSLENEIKERDAKVNKLEKKVVVNPEVSRRNEIVVEINSNTDELGKQNKQQQQKNHLGSTSAHGRVEENNGIKDEKVLLLLKSALVEFIMEILKPACKEGQMSKENHNIIVKKVVDKVISSIRGKNVPKTAVHVNEYMSWSKLNIFNIVNEYVRYLRRES